MPRGVSENKSAPGALMAFEEASLDEFEQAKAAHGTAGRMTWERVITEQMQDDVPARFAARDEKQASAIATSLRKAARKAGIDLLVVIGSEPWRVLAKREPLYPEPQQSTEYEPSHAPSPRASTSEAFRERIGA